ELKIAVEPAHDLPSAVRRSDICVTCTPAKKHFLRQEHVAPGTFVAAVGADNEDKQELDPRLLASSKVVADVLEQCAEIGDLHHAIAAGLMQRGDVHAELAEVVAGKKAGRTSQEEITIFDSTGTALQDAARRLWCMRGRGRVRGEVSSGFDKTQPRAVPKRKRKVSPPVRQAGQVSR